MANVVKYNARVTMKSDTKTNWDKATSFIPLKGEIIHYSDLNKIKIGDGTTYVTALKFIAENEIAALDADIQDAIEELRKSTNSSISAINERYNNTISPAVTKANNAVLYTAQTLTDAQKEQARKNIGLFSSSASNTVVDIKVKEATKADEATNATNAVNAKEAEHAETADSASQAGHASSADEAVHATTADAAVLAAVAEGLAEARTISLSGDATGSVEFDGTGDATINVTVVDDSHNHIMDNIDGLNSVLAAKANNTISITAGNGLTGGGNLTEGRTLNVGQGNGITVTADAVAAKAGSGITVDSNGINHADTSSQASVTANGRKYITGVTLDTYGHVTGLTTGNETVTDKDTTYDLSAPASKTNGNVTIDLTAGGSGSGTDSITIKGSGATGVTTDANGVITINSANTKVTSVGNHYTPATDTTKELSADASSTTAATWGSTDLVTGVNIQRDAAGHVTGVTVDSIQMPSNPDKNQTLKGNGTSFGVNDSVDFLGNGVITITPNTTNKTVTVGLTEDTSHRFVTDTEKENWNGKATVNYVDTKVAALIDSAPGTLDTLNELAAALGDDPNFATTMATEIGKKADKGITITAGNGLTGGGSLASNRTISHADTSSQSSIAASGRRYITGVTLDEYGHVTNLTTGTETVIDTDTTYTFATGSTNGTFTVTPKGGSAQSVSIKGLGSLAYKNSLSASDVGALTRDEIIALIQEAIEPYAIAHTGTTVPASSLGENGDVYIQY